MNEQSHPKIDISWSGQYEGQGMMYRITMDGEEIYCTTDERDRDMFIAELKGRLKLANPESNP